MAGPSEHAVRAQHNTQLALDFARALTDRPDWTIVLRFYAALHWLDAYLSKRGFDPKTHDERQRLIKRLPELSQARGRAFESAYRHLRDASESVRYDATYLADGADLEEARKSLATVESYLVSKIATTAPTEPKIGP